jgi:hypothetical protein
VPAVSLNVGGVLRTATMAVNCDNQVASGVHLPRFVDFRGCNCGFGRQHLASTSRDLTQSQHRRSQNMFLTIYYSIRNYNLTLSI